MATQNELIYSIREAYKLYSDDGNISNEYIAYELYIGRLLLLGQKFSSRGFIIPQKLRQHFYMPLELTDDNEFIANMGTILRTASPIQTPFEPFNFKNNIRINGGSYTDINFTLVQPDRLPYVGKGKWNLNQIYVTIGSDFRLYFVSSNPKVKLLENIKLSMVCEDPEEAYPFTIGYNSTVDFDHVEYPIEGDLIFPLTEMIIKKLTTNLVSKEDKVNDDNDGDNEKS